MPVPKLLSIPNMSDQEVRETYNALDAMAKKKEAQLGGVAPGSLRHRWYSRQHKSLQRDKESFLAKEASSVKLAAYESLLEDHPLWEEDFEKLAILPDGGSRLERAAFSAAVLGGLSLLGAGAGALASEEGNRASGALRGAVAGVAVPAAMSLVPAAMSRLHPRLEGLDGVSLLSSLASPAVAPLAGYLAAKHMARKRD